jgi:hypothetical protein
MEPACRAHRSWEHGAGSTLIPVESAPGLHGVVVIVRDDLTAEPSAHYRLVSGHDLFEMVASLDCTLRLPQGR